MDVFSVVLFNLTGAFGINCMLFLLTLLFALPLGLVLSFASVSKGKILSAISRAFVCIISSIPLLIMLFIFYYSPGVFGIGALWGIGIQGRFIAATVAFIISYSCLFSEIFRNGIQAVSIQQAGPGGQIPGIKISRLFTKASLLQVFKVDAAPMFRGIIALVRDTTLVGLIAVRDIFYITRGYTSMGLFWPLFTAAIYFVVFVGVLKLLFFWLEKKLDGVQITAK
jgi:polar amino acid transport system permease protein